MKIKIGIRHNLFYPMMAIIFSFFRGLVSVFIDKNLKFNDQSILTLLLVFFLSEFFSGAYFYKHQKKFLSKKSSEKKKTKTSPIDKYNSHNNKLKLHLLLLADSFFVLVEFLITTYYIKKIVGLSKSLDIPLRSILTFWTSFFCLFLLKDANC